MRHWLRHTAGKTGNASAQSQQLRDDTQAFYGAGAENDADSIAWMVGAQVATSMSSLPSGHVEVLLGQQVNALPAGLETFGARPRSPSRTSSPRRGKTTCPRARCPPPARPAPPPGRSR